MRRYSQRISTAALLGLLCLNVTSSSQNSPKAPILARDVDKRPLPEVAMADLSPAMRKEVQSLIDDAKANETPEARNRVTPPSLETAVYRIPVAPKGHKLYVVEQTGELITSPNGANGEADTVLDETTSGIETVTGGTGAAFAVVRRLNLQMPDIAAYEQLGHFAMYITVFRFDGTAWHTYLCKELPINDDPNPAVIADKPCK